MNEIVARIYSNGRKTDCGGPAAQTRQSDLLRDLFGGACVPSCLQAVARPARSHLSAISRHARTLGARRRAAQGYWRAAVSRLRHADAAAQAARVGDTNQATPQYRGRAAGSDRPDAAWSGAQGKSQVGAAINPCRLGLLYCRI